MEITIKKLKSKIINKKKSSQVGTLNTKTMFISLFPAYNFECNVELCLNS